MLGEDTKHKTKFHIHDLNFFLRVENMVYLTVETEHAQKSVVITCFLTSIFDLIRVSESAPPGACLFSMSRSRKNYEVSAHYCLNNF